MTADHNDDKNFMATFGLVLLALVGLTIFLIVVANIIGTVSAEADERDIAVLAANKAETLKPMGAVAVAGDEPAAPELSTADSVAQYCGACHAGGLAGAPKFDDAAAWNTRLAAAGGYDALVSSAINGKGGMPARGGSPLSDQGVADAVTYILEGAGIEVAASAEAPEASAPEAPVAAVSAEEVKSTYDTACAVCHAAGIAGAPKLGDADQWSARIAQGMDTLIDHAINGFNAMPPKGGRSDLSDELVAATVEYMVAESQ